MPSEFRRGTIRIVSNYARLLATFTLGIVYVPVFIYALGNEAFGLIGLIGSSIGLAGMCSNIVSTSLNRELTRAYHDPDRQVFLRTYNSAYILSAALGTITAGLFAVLYMCLPLLSISNDLMVAAQWVVICKATYAVISVVTAPSYLMWMITERMAVHNAWQTLNRSCELLSVLTLMYFIGVRDTASGLIAYGFIFLALSTLVHALSIVSIMCVESGLVPNPVNWSWTDIRQVVGTAGWNSAVTTAVNFHIRLDQIIMNVAFGLVMGNTIFAIAVRLTSYVRMLANGFTWGLDVVSARISTAEDQKMSVLALLRHTTLTHALVSFPAGVFVILYAEPILRLWVSRVVDDVTVVEKAVLLTQILALGMIGRSIANGWERVLYGAGHIRRYAPMILLGGLCNPVLAIGLIVLLPSTIAYTGPAMAYAAIFLTVHFIGLPIVASRCLSISLSDVLAPLVRPVIATLIASTILCVPLVAGWTIDLLMFIGSALAYGAVYAALSWRFTLSSDERHRLTRPVFKRLGLAGRA